MTTKLITARRRTPCKCGEWVTVGSCIQWDTVTKETVGCVKCHYSGFPSEPEAAFPLEDWEDFGNYGGDK